MNTAIDDSAVVGRRCRIGNFVTISARAVLGDDVFIGHNVIIHPGARIGDRTNIQDHAVIGRQPISSTISTRKVDHCEPIQIGAECIIGSHVVLYAGVVLEDAVMVADLASIRERTVVRKQAIVGRGVLVEYDTVIGERTKIQTGTHLTGNMIIESDVFIGGEVCTMNDKQLDRDGSAELIGPRIRRGARIGCNATILPGVIIGIDAVVGAGATVTKDVPDATVVSGPAAKYLKDAPPEFCLNQWPLRSPEPNAKTHILDRAPRHPVLSQHCPPRRTVPSSKGPMVRLTPDDDEHAG